MAEDSPGNAPLLLRLPKEIRASLLKDSKKHKKTVQAIILDIVATHYAIEHTQPQRGRPANATK